MTLHNLIGDLSHRSATIAQMQLTNDLADTALSNGLRRLSQTTDDLDRVARGLESLVGVANLSPGDAKVLVRNLLSQNYYGQFCELAAYDWLIRHDALFAAQVPVAAAACLNPNPVTLDGRFTGCDVFFDVKAMGFQTYVMEQFRRRLQESLPQFIVQIDGSLDVAVKDIELYAFPKLGQIKQELNTGGRVQIPQLNWTVKAEARRNINFATQMSNPYALAEENRFFPFKTSSQFVRREPFIMIFAYNAAINPNLFLNFSGSTDITLRSLARRAFLQFVGDYTLVRTFDEKADPTATLADAAALLSALMFIDFGSDEARLYLNPKARNQLTTYHIKQIFDFAPPVSMLIDDFQHDVY